MDEASGYDAWHKLIHVCQSWRCVVFASPRRLNLRLLCTPKRSVKKMLDVWPALPIVIEARVTKSTSLDMVNIISALRQHDRVCKIDMTNIPNSLLTQFVAMKGPFPALTFLGLAANDENRPVLPDSFLVGSVQRLRVLNLQNIPFPTLGKLLLTTSDLVHLRLWRIPHSGYISPETLVDALAAQIAFVFGAELYAGLASNASSTVGFSLELSVMALILPVGYILLDVYRVCDQAPIGYWALSTEPRA